MNVLESDIKSFNVRSRINSSANKKNPSVFSVTVKDKR